MQYKLLLLLISLSTLSLAQKNDWYANFYNIMDNREYDKSIGEPLSIMAARLDFAVGMKQDSTSGVYGGLNYMYEYGGTLDSITPALNLYYSLNRANFSFYAGSFAKEKVIDFPLFMFSDSLNYYMPNMGGMAFEFKRQWGKQNIFVDWTGRQSHIKRESFIVGFSGVYKKNTFYLENYGYMYHYALTKGYDPNEHIRDNGTLALFVGADMSQQTGLDILKYDLGVISNYDRSRPSDYAFHNGVMGRLSAYYKRFGMDVTSYWGDALRIPLGDQLYQNGNYTRTNFCVSPIKGSHIESVFKWSFHFANGIVSNSQQFFLIARF